MNDSKHGHCLMVLTEIIWQRSVQNWNTAMQVTAKTCTESWNTLWTMSKTAKKLTSFLAKCMSCISCCHKIVQNELIT